MNIRKRFFYEMAVLCAAMVVATALWLYAIVAKGTPAALRATVPLILIVLAIRIVHDRFCKNGYYSKKQAKAFYDACQTKEIHQVKLSALEECDRIYREVVSTVELGEKAHRLALYEKIYLEGKAISEGEKH